jgi:hypothetical protein
VIYNDLKDVCDAVCALNSSKLTTLEDSCFSGNYVTPEVTTDYMVRVEDQRRSVKALTSSVLSEGVSSRSVDETTREGVVRSDQYEDVLLPNETNIDKSVQQKGQCETIHNDS